MANEFNAQQNAAVPATTEYVGEMEAVTVRPPADISTMTLTPKDAALVNAMQSLTNEYWELVDGFFRESPNAALGQWTKRFEEYLLNEERFAPILQKNAVALEAIHDHEMHTLSDLQQRLREATKKLQQTCNVAQDNAITGNQPLPADISPRLKQIYALHDSIVRDLQFLGYYQPESELSAEVIRLQGLGNQVFAGGKYEEMKASIEMNLPPTAEDRDTFSASTLDYTAMLRVLGDPFTSRVFEARRDETMGRGDFNLLALQDAANLIRDTQNIERSMAVIEGLVSGSTISQCQEKQGVQQGIGAEQAIAPRGPLTVGMVLPVYGTAETSSSKIIVNVPGNPDANSDNEIVALLSATVKKITGGTVTTEVDKQNTFIISVEGVDVTTLRTMDAEIRKALIDLKDIPRQSAAATSGILLQSPSDASLADLGALNANVSRNVFTMASRAVIS